jgi:hypothetical protein
MQLTTQVQSLVHADQSASSAVSSDSHHDQTMMWQCGNTLEVGNKFEFALTIVFSVVAD